MSMSNDTEATISVTPTATQTIYQTSNDLTVSNTCSYGATITMKTSGTDNSLSRSDGVQSSIGATSGSTTLDEGTWGWSDDGTNWSAVPDSNGTAATVYDESSSASSVNVPVNFGVKVDNSLPAGTYTNDVVYTMTPKTGCLTYDVTWDLDGGTAASGATYPTTLNWGATVDLTALTPTKSGYTFAGWTNGTDTFDGTEITANLNPNNSNSVTVTAIWEEDVSEYVLYQAGASNNPTISWKATSGDGCSVPSVSMSSSGINMSGVHQQGLCNAAPRFILSTPLTVNQSAKINVALSYNVTLDGSAFQIAFSSTSNNYNRVWGQGVSINSASGTTTVTFTYDETSTLNNVYLYFLLGRIGGTSTYYQKSNISGTVTKITIEQ